MAEEKKRKVFYSFHFDKDCWRTQQVRQIGVIEGDSPVSKNAWEEVRRGKDAAIKKWIEDSLKNKSCTIVLVGSKTSTRPWVLHEIKRSWKLNKGILGICIHNLKDEDRKTSIMGENPFDNFLLNKEPLSKIIKLYNPPTKSIKSISDPSLTASKIVYNHISENILNWVEEAIKIRANYK